jgi:hypothetical protein
MESIGGYFGLELRRGSHYHSEAIKLNTARNCFEYILRARKYKKVYIPFYTCEAMLVPIHKLNVNYEFYSIDNELNPIFNKKLGDSEAFIYTNYFGLKQGSVESLAEKVGRNLIIDNAQAFFAKPVKDIDTFYSARKFIGVADGAYLFTCKKLENNFDRDASVGRMSHLLKRIDKSSEEAYPDFKKNENDLGDDPIKHMSRLTDAILASVDYKYVKSKRINNFKFLEDKLGSDNMLSLSCSCKDIPMVYPFYTEDKDMRERLIKNRIYTAIYWTNVFEWCNENRFENRLARCLIPLPIDQRYDERDMTRIVKLIK